MRDSVRYHVLPADPVFDDLQEKAGRADEALVGRVFTEACRQIVYEYDFGDSWEHVVKLEKRTAGGDQSHVPQCLAGENAAPRDDMGGIDGYYHWLDALRDADHESHEEAADILGEDFDPTHFDLDLANRHLAQTFKPAPKRRRKPKEK